MAESSPIDNLAAAEAFLLQRINYERTPTIPYQERHLKLQRMLELLDRLDNPHARSPCLHVAGTKGKGSTCAMLTSMLAANGYKVGTYTSPHFQTVLERLAINGRPCDAATFVELVQKIVPIVRSMDADPDEANRPTFFEILTALAFLYFRQQQVDISVFEVGLGGRLDSTNVCQPLVCAITSISLDHMLQLGDDLASIAREKAGIIKAGVPVISGVREQPARNAITEIARHVGSPMWTLGTDFDVRYDAERACMEYSQSFAAPPVVRPALPLAARGAHQADNAAIALACLDALREVGWQMDERQLERGLADVQPRGRIEVVNTRPCVILDTAHNAASIAALLDVLDHDFHGRRCVFVFGTTRGKDISGMLTQLARRSDHVILTQYRNNPRSHDAHSLAKMLDTIVAVARPDGPLPVTHEVVPTCEEAWARARALAGPNDVICVCGSFFLVAELEPSVRGAAD